jgi:hypothetical protein
MHIKLQSENLKRCRHKWEDNIKMDLEDVVRTWTGFNWHRIWFSGVLL